MRVLRQHGATPAVARVSAPQPAILENYLHFLAEHRGIGTARIERHRVHVEAFLQSLRDPNTCSGLDSQTVSRFITKRAPALGRAERKAMCAALRTFLRFLRFRGVLKQDLTTAVPVIPSFKLDRLPRVISWEDVQKILAAVDRSTPVGRRDYVLLLMLATYGIRCSQPLRLEDIDWRHNILRIRAAKGGRFTVLPLRPAVGEALVDYLRHGRPTWPFREVFLRTRAPMGPLGRNLGNIIKWYARKAGLSVGSFGPHAWRHACATRMLAHGQPLKTIRDVLGHRTIETTFIYTKVDIEHLRQAALEWPEVTL
jgi:site-specific recombinase XerD